MSKEMVISANPHETRVAILEEGQLCEYYVEREKEFALVGSIYKGKVTRVLPGMQSAFVEIGLDSDAFLYVSDFLEEIEGLDHAGDDKSSKHSNGPARSEHSSHAAPASSAPVEHGGGDHAVTAMEGESISGGVGGGHGDAGESQPPANYTPSSFVARPPAGSQQHDRPRFDRGGDRGGDRNRGFNRRGGRNRQRGGGGGRGPGGDRGGRSSGGGDRRFGRDLPSSKYASPRSRDDQPQDPNVPVGHISTVLPGESISRFRDRGDAPSSAPAQETSHESSHEPRHEAAHDPFNVAPPAEAAEQEAQPHSEHEHQPPRDYQPREPRRFDRGGGRYGRDRGPRHSAGPRFSHSSVEGPSSAPSGPAAHLEPLPGESISKWKAHAHLPPDPVDDAPAAHVDEVESHVAEARGGDQHDELGMHASRALDAIASEEKHERPGAAETHHEDEHHDEPHHESLAAAASHATEEHHDEHLTEEEAAALAEHIAEAQEERSALESHGHEHDAHENEAHHDEVRAHDDHVEHEDHEDADDAEDDDEADDEADEAHEAIHVRETEAETIALADIDPEGAPEPHEGDEIESFESRAEALMSPDALGSEEGTDAAADEIIDSADSQADAILSADAAQQPPNEARVRSDFRPRMQNPARRGGRDRGDRGDRGRRDNRHGRPHHHGHHRSHPPRKVQLIADMLKQGQEIIVQIAKEPLGKKGARITSHVALPGRFLVYMPTLDHTGVSRKIASAEERSRLRHLVNDAKGTSGGGFIVRTAAASAAPDDVRADVEFLTRTWAEIKTRSESKKAPSLLHRDLNLVERILRDFVTPDFGAIWVDSEEGYTKVVEFMSRFQPQLVSRVKLYSKQTPVFEEFGIQQEIDKGLRPKVWLKSGGYIVINHTEALVAIDVNTGKFVGKGSNRLEDTIVRTNVEAVKEIVRQMRLRDLGGIIVIDFIDMEERRNRDKVMAALEDALRADRAPSKVLRFNEFGLVAITRKRTKQALERTLCQPCPYCTGSGMVKSIATLCYELQTEAMKMSPEMPSASLTLRVHPEISKALKTREASLIEELERWTKKSVIIQADPTLHWEQYDIY